MITTESAVCIDSKEADLIDIQTVIEEIENLCCPDFMPEWYEKAFEDIKDSVIETIRSLPNAKQEGNRKVSENE